MVLEWDFMRGKWMKMVVYWEFPMDFQWFSGDCVGFNANFSHEHQTPDPLSGFHFLLPFLVKGLPQTFSSWPWPYTENTKTQASNRPQAPHPKPQGPEQKTTTPRPQTRNSVPITSWWAKFHQGYLVRDCQKPSPQDFDPTRKTPKPIPQTPGPIHHIPDPKTQNIWLSVPLPPGRPGPTRDIL